MNVILWFLQTSIQSVRHKKHFNVKVDEEYYSFFLNLNNNTPIFPLYWLPRYLVSVAQ